MTPLDCALQRGFRSTAKYLQLHGGVPASRLGGAKQDTQVSSSLSLQIRDDVTFWGDSSSDSEQNNVKDGRSARKVQKRKLSFRNRKKKPLMSESESDVAKVQSKNDKVVKTSAKRTTTVTTATNTSGNESPRKPASSRIDYSNEIIINGKTEINIHQSNEITNQASPRIVEIDSSETITVPASGKSTASDREKRPKSAKFSKLSKEKSMSDKEGQSSTKDKDILGQSTGTSDDTMDTVIDTYKQKAESIKAEMRQSSRERMLELPEISNTSEETEEPHEMVVEASVHPEPKQVQQDAMEDVVQVKSILKTTETFLDTEKEIVDGESESHTTTIIEQVIKVDAGDSTIYQEEKTVEIVTETVEETTDKKEQVIETSKETIESLTKAAVVKKDDGKNGAIKEEKPAKEAESEDEEITVKDKKTPVSKVVGKPRDKKKPAAKDGEEPKRTSPKDESKQKKESKTKKASEQPAIVRILKPGEKIADDQKQLSEDEKHSSSSEIISDSMEQASKTHKSFKVLSEKEAKELASKSKSKPGKQVKAEDKKPRSKSDDTKFKKQVKEDQRKQKRSKIPTPTFQTPLSKSERQLDRLLEYERMTQSVIDARVPSLPNIHETSRDR